jgi:hypothetical protein
MKRLIDAGLLGWLRIAIASLIAVISSRLLCAINAEGNFKDVSDQLLLLNYRKRSCKKNLCSKVTQIILKENI